MENASNVLEVVARLYDAALDDSLWASVLSDVENLLHANNIHLLVASKDTGVPVFGINSRCPEANDEYVSHYAQIDERWPRALKLPHASPVMHERLYRKGEMRVSPTYNEFLAKYDGQCQTITRMDGPEGDHVVFGAIRQKSRGPFEGSEVEMLRYLLPHILRVVHIRHALVSVGALNQSLAGLLENSQLGVILLDRDGSILEANRSAASILQQGDGLTIERGFVQASSRQDHAAMQTLLAEAIAQGLRAKSGSGGTLQITRPSMLRPLGLFLVPICSEHLDFGARRPVVAMLIIDPENRLDISTDEIARLYGLTSAESRLAVALAQGQSLQEYSEANALSDNTVRWTLKNVMSKTDTRRQGELIRLILVGPAGLGTPIDWPN